MLSLTELVTYEAFHFTAVSPRCSKEISIEYRHLNRDSAPVDQLNQLMREKRETKNFQKERERGKGNKTRPDTRLPKSRVGGLGPYLRSPDHLGRSSDVKEIKS